MHPAIYTIPVIPGDGVGPEIIVTTSTILIKVAELEDFNLNLVQYQAGVGAYQKMMN